MVNEITTDIEQSTSVVVVTTPPEPTKPPVLVKSIDINYYINYANNYAQSVGLTLDNSATECWDNPISVTVITTNAENNISSRLNQYKNVEEVTAVCIWHECIS